MILKMSSSTQPTTTTITASCACKSFAFNTTLPTSSLPLPTSLCLCLTCRLTSGTTGGTSYIPLPHTSSFTQLNFSSSRFPSFISYDSSAEVVRWFCGTCGAHTSMFRKEKKELFLATGLCESTEGVVRWAGVRCVEETSDGGVAVWLRGGVDDSGCERKKMKAWMGSDVSVSMNTISNEDLVRLSTREETRSTTTDKKDVLNASCHCGGVQFYITRPNDQSAQAYSPFPDLMIPYNSGRSAQNPTHEPWFLRGTNKDKYLAGTCTCTSCRQNLGFEIQAWAFVPKINIFSKDGSSLDYAKMGKLKRYESSQGVHREFCGGCGATVFWHCDERPGVVDVSTGLLIGGKGVRCEEWLDWWTERVSFRELAVSQDLVGMLERGLKDWGMGKRVQNVDGHSVET